MEGTGAVRNTARLTRILLNRSVNVRLAWQLLRRGMPPLDLVRLQAPFSLPDASRPPSLTVELTNRCQLACRYCPQTMRLSSPGMMDARTLSILAEQIAEARIRYVRVIGRGEATLHPNFNDAVRAFVQAAGFVSLGTNGQSLTEDRIEAILKAPLAMVKVSVDGASAEEYEARRVGASYRTLIQNLKTFMAMRRAMKAKTVLSAMLMVEREDLPRLKHLRDFWAPYVDCVGAIRILDYGVEFGMPQPHAFRRLRSPDRAPRCSMPFKVMDVHWNGNVPLCSYSCYQCRETEGVLIGNLREHSLLELWRSETFRRYRLAHRCGNAESIPVCVGCAGV